MSGSPLDGLRRALVAQLELLGQQLAAVDEAEQSLAKLRAAFGVFDCRWSAPDVRFDQQTQVLVGFRAPRALALAGEHQL